MISEQRKTETLGELQESINEALQIAVKELGKNFVSSVDAEVRLCDCVAEFVRQKGQTSRAVAKKNKATHEFESQYLAAVGKVRLRSGGDQEALYKALKEHAQADSRFCDELLKLQVALAVCDAAIEENSTSLAELWESRSGS